MEPFIPFTPAQVRRHRFCFCVPVRWGVWILSAVEAVVSAMLCIANFLALFSTQHGRPWLVGVRVAGVLGWGTCVVMCGFGWIGTIEQKRKWVEWYYLLCWWHVCLIGIFGFVSLLLLNLPGARVVAQGACVTVALAQKQLLHLAQKVSAEEAANVVGACERSVQIGLILTDLSWAIAVLLELWLGLIVGHYLDELADRDAAIQYGVDIESAEAPYSFAGIPDGAQMEKKYRSTGKVGAARSSAKMCGRS